MLSLNGLRVFVLGNRNNDSLELGVEIAICSLWNSYATELTSKARVTVLAGDIDRDYEGEISLLLYNENKKYYVWKVGEPLGYCLYTETILKL